MPLGVPLPPVDYAFTPSSWGTDVSADGSVVVGSDLFIGAGNYGYAEAFRWTRDGGKAVIGPGSARGVSPDGSVIVGSGNFPNGYQAFRWTSAGGTVALGDLPGGIVNSNAADVSADGSVIVGSGNSADGQRAFRWTSDDGMVALGALTGHISSHASGVSSDGSVIVGASHHIVSGNQEGEAFRWTSEDGMVGLGTLPGTTYSGASAVSADGSVIVGSSILNVHLGRREAFRWTNDGGMIGLGHLPNGFSESYAYDVCADGSVVVGNSGEAFVWDVTHGMRRVSDVLMDRGVDLTGWTLTSAAAISADGTIIVGRGRNPLGQTEAWLANVAVVPEPAAAAIVLAGLLVLVGCRRRTSIRQATWKGPTKRCRRAAMARLLLIPLETSVAPTSSAGMMVS